TRLAREAHRVLDRLGTTVGEEHRPGALKRVLDNTLRKLAAGVVCQSWLNRRHAAGLILNCLDESRVLVAHVEVDELRREVEVFLAVVIPEPHALALSDRQRID